MIVTQQRSTSLHVSCQRTDSDWRKFMHSGTAPAPVSKGKLWTARLMSTLIVLFLLFDAAIHLAKPTPVVDAFAKLGFPLSASVGIGVVEFLCLATYVIPRTAALGAVLLTGLQIGRA